jgi:seryl-tRNA synthetase
MTDIADVIDDAVDEKLAAHSAELDKEKENEKWMTLELRLAELDRQVAEHQTRHDAAEEDRKRLTAELAEHREKALTDLTELSTRLKTVEEMEIVETPEPEPEPEPLPEEVAESVVDLPAEVESEESESKKHYTLV